MRLRQPLYVQAVKLFVAGEIPHELMKARTMAACGWFGVEPLTDGLFFLSRENVE